MSEDLDRASDKLHDALSAIVRTEDTVMISKWVCLMEVIGEDGKQQLWSLTSPGMSVWDHVGLVEYHNRALQPPLRNEEDDD
jgi:hypothetical protein